MTTIAALTESVQQLLKSALLHPRAARQTVDNLTLSVQPTVLAAASMANVQLLLIRVRQNPRSAQRPMEPQMLLAPSLVIHAARAENVR